MTTREQIEQEIKRRQEWLAVLADFEAGYEMQVELDGEWRAWIEDGGLRVGPSVTSMARYKFRRKPEPLRGWVNLYPDDAPVLRCEYLGGGNLYLTEEIAKSHATKDCIGQAEFVQVL